MLRPTLLSALPLLMLAEQALGFGCSTHSFTTCEDKIVHWFDPDDGMICDPLDCGGGRAPPKTDVPGCAGYTGTKTRGGVSYLSCWKPSTTLVVASAKETTEAETTEDAKTTADAESTTDNEPTTALETIELEPTSTEWTIETRTTTKGVDEGEQKTSSATETDSASSIGPTTPAPVVPTQTQSESAEEGASTPTAEPNAARALEGSLIAVAGIAIGAFIFA
ncbi:hypothetical protein NW762_001515 [Fusarium torreyae]|uniref:Siderophore biosynthesis n=1 Tax=Fusarium torreyae TaxID=1237075 RepID=A0A9W8SE81_9HYPO|nr:hypothetical protein NW762_001515 [Fusarium torreyae]